MKENYQKEKETESGWKPKHSAIKMQKAKKYDFKDSNLALFGSPLERKVKEAAAETEVAWHGSGEKEGIEVWRIVKFKVVPWPKEQHGEFYMGDSYIILRTYKVPDEEELQMDLHFWIGKYSTQDEYGAAAYKTVELDTFHKDKPVQHREVQGHESQLFKSYFPTIQYLSGGADSGFRHVTPEEYRPRLLHISGTRKNVTVKEVNPSRKNLKDSDVFILDMGTNLMQWNGKGANIKEKTKGMQFLAELKGSRSRDMVTSTVYDDGDDREFMQKLDEIDAIVDDDEEEITLQAGEKQLFKLSDADGKMSFSKVGEGSRLDRKLLDPADVFILDSGDNCFVWIGSSASTSERKSAMSHAHAFLMDSDHPVAPITVFAQGKEIPEFRQCFA